MVMMAALGTIWWYELTSIHLQPATILIHVLIIEPYIASCACRVVGADVANARVQLYTYLVHVYECIQIVEHAISVREVVLEIHRCTHIACMCPP